MQKNVKTTFWILILCAGCFFVAWNVRLVLTDRPTILLTVMPEVVRFQAAFPEGVEFRSQFTLENMTRTNIIITRVLSSCGCTALSTEEGQPLVVPFVLFPSKPFSILVTVDTKNREGKNGVSVAFRYEYDGKPLVAVGNIFFDVVMHDESMEQDDVSTLELE